MKNKLLLPSIILAFCLITLLVLNNRIEANPSQINLDASASATTTSSYITPGAATTTDVFDTQADGGYPMDSAVLLMWMQASSTSSIVDIYPQYSDGINGVDCTATPLKCSWFFASNPADYATTTLQADISILPRYRWQYSASSTPDFGVVLITTATTTTRALSIKTPTRYVRAVFVVPTGAGNLGIWSEWAGKRQR